MVGLWCSGVWCGGGVVGRGCHRCISTPQCHFFSSTLCQYKEPQLKITTVIDY